jgi:hypothetical protein
MLRMIRLLTRQLGATDDGAWCERKAGVARKSWRHDAAAIRRVAREAPIAPGDALASAARHEMRRRHDAAEREKALAEHRERQDETRHVARAAVERKADARRERHDRLDAASLDGDDAQVDENEQESLALKLVRKHESPRLDSLAECALHEALDAIEGLGAVLEQQRRERVKCRVRNGGKLIHCRR